MPAAVELTHRAGGIRQVKVARDGKPQHLPKPHRHEGIAVEVEIELQTVAHRAQPRQRRREIFKADALERRPQRRELIGDEHLAAKTDDEALKAELRVRAARRARFERIAPLAVAQDGSHDELGKGDDEGGVVDQVFLRPCPAVHVDGVARALEQVKAQPQRQRERDDGKFPPCQHTQIFQNKTGIFEKNQKIQICREREQQKRQPRRSVPPVHHACKGIVNEDRRTEQQRVARARATEVKREAAQHENRIFQRTGDEIVDRQKKRQKIKQEG